MILLQNVTVITKCDVYYKLRQYTVPVLRQVANLEVTSIRDRNNIKKIHLENSSIFHQFWKSNRQVIHVELMSFFPRRFLFHKLWNISMRKLKIDGKSKKMLVNLIKTSQYQILHILQILHLIYLFSGCLISGYLFYPRNSTIDPRKTFITQEWLVVESCPIPHWIAILLFYQLVYNIHSHFNELILAWGKLCEGLDLSHNDYNLVGNLVTVTTG